MLMPRDPDDMKTLWAALWAVEFRRLTVGRALPGDMAAEAKEANAFADRALDAYKENRP